MQKEFIINDEAHGIQSLGFSTLEDVIAELKRLANIPWDHEPNKPPCTNWENCGRRYEVIEHDQSKQQWTELSRKPALDISAKGIVWSNYFNS